MKLAVSILIALFFTAACSSPSDPGGPTDKQKSVSSFARMQLISVQFGVDAGFIPSPAKITPGALSNDGLVQPNYDFRDEYVSSLRNVVFGDSTTSVDDEATQNAVILGRIDRLQSMADRNAHVAPLTPDAAARLVVAQELIDAGYLTRSALGVPGDPRLINPSTAVDAWLDAHADDPLRPGAKVTIGQELARTTTFITEPVAGAV